MPERLHPAQSFDCHFVIGFGLTHYHSTVRLLCYHALETIVIEVSGHGAFQRRKSLMTRLKIPQAHLVNTQYSIDEATKSGGSEVVVLAKPDEEGICSIPND